MSLCSMSVSASDDEASLRSTPVMVYYTGLVKWGFSLKSQSACQALDMTLFPFDTPNCTIGYSTRISTKNDITLYSATNFILANNYMENGEFMIKSNSVMTTTWKDTWPVVEYSVINFNLMLKRRPTFYVLNMLLPCVALVLLGLLAFCLPVTSGERVGLQVTMLLSFSIYQLLLYDYIPSGSTNIPMLCK